MLAAGALLFVAGVCWRECRGVRSAAARFALFCCSCSPLVSWCWQAAEGPGLLIVAATLRQPCMIWRPPSASVLSSWFLHA